MVSVGALTPAQHTRVFLGLLQPQARTCTFHFRTFDDRKGRDRIDLRGNLSGTLASYERKLLKRNRDGAGVFLVINEGGYSDDLISSVRAVFVDTDGAALDPIRAALAPHCVVQSSPGKWHVYWMVENAFPLASFRPLQAALAKKFGTDPSVVNPSRVMRLPGFLHNKGAPFRVALQHVNEGLSRYSLAQLTDAFQLDVDQLSRGASGGGRNLSEDARAGGGHSFPELEDMLRFIDPWSGRGEWMKVLFALAEECGEAGRDLAVRWSRGDLWMGRNI